MHVAEFLFLCDHPCLSVFLRLFDSGSQSVNLCVLLYMCVCVCVCVCVSVCVHLRENGRKVVADIGNVALCQSH